MMKNRILKCCLALATVLFVYCLGYGLVRWRKFIVMREYILKEELLLVRQVGPGRDVRTNWRGRLKNQINPIIFIFFRPVVAVEDQIRGFQKPLDLTST